jgi:hypothetical protein
MSAILRNIFEQFQVHKNSLYVLYVHACHPKGTVSRDIFCSGFFFLNFRGIAYFYDFFDVLLLSYKPSNFARAILPYAMG